MWGDDTGRGQAFTLEGLIGAIILLTAVLFALQSINAVPSSSDGPQVEQSATIEVDAKDVLRLSARNETFGLSEMVRYYSPVQGQFYGAVDGEVGYGTQQPPGGVGSLLESTVTEQGRTYNLQLRYRNENLSDGWKRTTVVARGQPDDDAIVATYIITLYDNQTLTSPTTTGIELQEVSSDPSGGTAHYPIPNAFDGPVYNVVEVRLIVW